MNDDSERTPAARLKAGCVPMRQPTPTERLSMALQLQRLSISMVRARLRHADPEADDAEIDQRLRHEYLKMGPQPEGFRVRPWKDR